MRAGTLRVSGGLLETACWGPDPSETPTIVLLHEGLGCVALWRDVPERLAAATGWGVFAYSRFGYGQSDLVTLPRSMTYMHHEAQVVLPEVLKGVGIGQAVLVGHSDGGSIAAIAGSSGPASVHHDPDSGASIRGLVMIAAHFFVEDLNIASIRQIKVDYETGDLRLRLARHHRDPDIAFRGWNDAWLDPRFRDFDITGLLPGIQAPILALQGADDPYGTPEQLSVLQAHVQAPVRVGLIPNAKHAPHLEAKDATLAAITAFITELRNPPN